MHNLTEFISSRIGKSKLALLLVLAFLSAAFNQQLALDHFSGISASSALKANTQSLTPQFFDQKGSSLRKELTPVDLTLQALLAEGPGDIA